MKKFNFILLVAGIAFVTGACAKVEVECAETMICNNTNREILISGVVSRNSYHQNPQITEGITPISMTLAPYSKHKFDTAMKISSGKMRVTAILGKDKLSNVSEPMLLPGSYEVSLGSGNMIRVKPMNTMEVGKVSMSE